MRLLAVVLGLVLAGCGDPLGVADATVVAADSQPLDGADGAVRGVDALPVAGQQGAAIQGQRVALDAGLDADAALSDASVPVDAPWWLDVERRDVVFPPPLPPPEGP